MTPSWHTIAPPSHDPAILADSDRVVGITTTVPVECVFAAGLVPVDLNNVFIDADGPGAMVEEAEASGFPKNICCWIKGIWSAARRLNVRRVIGVVRGDCSNTHGLLEVFSYQGVEAIPFAYPYERSKDELLLQLQALCDHLGATLHEAVAWKERLDTVRTVVHEIDRMTWQEHRVSGLENHLWQVCCSDFAGDPHRYLNALKRFTEIVRGREAEPAQVRLGYVGVPPICPGLHEFVEGLGARFVFNEMQRQFSMPAAVEQASVDSLLQQYLRYTYPYDVFARLRDVGDETKRRRLDGIVHYTQSFCFRQLEAQIVRRELEAPVLDLDVDRPAPIDATVRTRLEAFIEMLSQDSHADRRDQIDT